MSITGYFLSGIKQVLGMQASCLAIKDVVENLTTLFSIIQWLLASHFNIVLPCLARAAQQDVVVLYNIKRTPLEARGKVGHAVGKGVVCLT